MRLFKRLWAAMARFASQKKAFGFIALTGLVSLALTGTALAFTEPTSGELFYEVYDLAMNQIFSGPAGVVIAAIMVCGALVLMGMGRGLLSPLLLLLCGAAVFFIKPIVLSFGYSLQVAQALDQSKALF